MTDEVAELVLRHNYDQAAALGMARTHSRAPLPVHRALIADLERRGQLDRRLEALPTDEELDGSVGPSRRRAGGRAVRSGLRGRAGSRTACAAGGPAG